ncbi:MAG: hypothetical protein BGO98_36340 [Myxococcales bacterium 68-20]|nr:DUF4202 family protein [Myxococcales bacterium]OJY26054.1 MAG: hypothetical protein BGO98_36340 [Myxococcales bacterium 68-20]
METRARTKLQRLILVVTEGALSPSKLRRLEIEMPSVRVENAAPGEGNDALVVETDGWYRDDEVFMSVDRELDACRRRTTAIVVRGCGADLPGVAIEVLTRCQRFVDRRNAASSVPLWDDVLLAHEELHDCGKPLVKADLDHAIDTWQWALRLAPNANLTVQLAALFHDIERLESEAELRVEHHAPDYAAFKERHARRGADRAYEILCHVGVDRPIALRVRELVAVHERRGQDPGVELLNDADGLSFFSLNSPGYADYFGLDQTRRKVAYTLARLGAEARARLPSIRMREDVARLVAAEAGWPLEARGGAR